MMFVHSAAEMGWKTIVIATFSLAVALGTITTAQAGESFGNSLPTTKLTTIRGGDNTNTDSNNNIATTTTNSTTTATSQGNSIGGDAPAGAINVNSNAFTDMHGMSNVVMNTGNLANVQGVMNLNLTLH